MSRPAPNLYDRIHDRIVLRPADEADRTFSWAVKEAALRPYVEAVWGWDESEQRAFHRRDWESSRPDIILLDGKPVGTIAIHREVGTGGCWHFGEFYILPEFQRRGIGTRVLHDLIREAASAGFGLRLEVIRINPAKRLYDRHGFRVTGETETHVLMERERSNP